MTLESLLNTLEGELKITISKKTIQDDSEVVTDLITLYNGGADQLNTEILSETVSGIEVLGKTRIQVWLDTTPGGD